MNQLKILILTSALAFVGTNYIMYSLDSQRHPNYQLSSMIADSINPPLPEYRSKMSKSSQLYFREELEKTHQDIMNKIDSLKDSLETTKLTVPGALELGWLSITKEEVEEILNSSTNTNYKIDNSFELDTRG